MRNRPVVIHLIDDTTAGGVMRVLDHITTSSDMAQIACHQLVQVQRGQVSLQRYKCDIIVSHLAISWRTTPVFAAIRLANRHARFVHVEHSYTEGFVQHNVPNKLRFHTLLKTAFALFDAVVAVSHGQAQWIRQAGLCPEHKLSVIRSCVDLSAFRRLEPARQRPKVIGAIGRLDRQKGLDVLVKAFRQIKQRDIALNIYGTGHELDALQALADGDPRIHFKGHTADPLSAHKDVDVLVVPSLWEAYGLVAIEGLCAGRKVLCADVDGLKDHIEYGAVALRDVSVTELSRQLDALCANPHLGRETVENDIGQRAEAEFVSGWRELLGTLLHCPNAPVQKLPV
jgi:glycosyltransferase involved in cell wall biosynthesis